MNYANDVHQGMGRLYPAPCSLCRATPNQYPRDHFHSSEIGYCPLKLQYMMVAPDPQKRTEVNEAFLADGHIHEDASIRALEAMGHVITHKNTEYVHEFKHYDEDIKIVLHTDGIMDNKYILEHKALKDWMWKRLFAGEAFPFWYTVQLDCYLDYHKMVTGIWLIKSRHTSQVFQQPYMYDRDLLWGETGIYRRLAGIKKAMRSQRLVPKPYATKDNSECKFCFAKISCWGEE